MQEITDNIFIWMIMILLFLASGMYYFWQLGRQQNRELRAYIRELLNQSDQGRA